MEQLKACVGLINPKSPDNVGSVMRAAGNYGVDAVYYTGTRYQRALKFNSESNSTTPNTRRSISQHIALTGVHDLLKQVSVDMQIVCIEFAENAIALPDYQHPEMALYLFGPEDGNISQDIINKADAVVYVPTDGCMNLAATVNVVLYDRLAKSKVYIQGNELIRESRDKNNNLKVR